MFIDANEFKKGDERILINGKTPNVDIIIMSKSQLDIIKNHISFMREILEQENHKLLRFIMNKE